MQRIRNVFSLMCCLIITFIMLMIGVLAATTVSLGVSVTVSYEPGVFAKVYIATSNPTNSGNNNYYYSGTGDFPTPSFLIGDNYTPTTITNPTISNAFCDTFGYYTIYIKVINYSPIHIQASISMTKSDGTASTNFTIIENNGITKIFAKANQTINTGFASVKIKANSATTEALKFTINLTQSLT